ncbi:hypothetical protein ACFE04_012969 [Oxalis oulophora]
MSTLYQPWELWKMSALPPSLLEVRDEIEQLLDDDGDMAEMYLTEKKERSEAFTLENLGNHETLFAVNSKTPHVSPVGSVNGLQKLQRAFSTNMGSRHGILSSSSSGHAVVTKILQNKRVSRNLECGDIFMIQSVKELELEVYPVVDELASTLAFGKYQTDEQAWVDTIKSVGEGKTVRISTMDWLCQSQYAEQTVYWSTLSSAISEDDTGAYPKTDGSLLIMLSVKYPVGQVMFCLYQRMPPYKLGSDLINNQSLILSVSEKHSELRRHSRAVDRVYLHSPNIIAVIDHEKKRTYVVRKEGLPDAAVWNPWEKKSKAMANFGDEEYKQMLCVDGAAVEKAVSLKPGEEWTGRLDLMVDRVYLHSPNIIAVIDHEKKRTYVVRKEGLPDAAVWNPWEKKSKVMANFGDEEYKQMLCVDGATVEKAVSLKPGEEWTGRLDLMVILHLLKQHLMIAWCNFLHDKYILAVILQVDRVYLHSPNIIAVIDHEKKRTYVVRKEGLPDAAVWNPWEKKSKAMANFGDEEYKQMLCVDGAAVEKAVSLKPGEEWTGRLDLMVVASSLCCSQGFGWGACPM